MKRLNELLNKCIENNLNFDYSDCVTGVYISKTVMDEEEAINTEQIAYGYIKNWRWNSPDLEIERLHQAVDEYLESQKVKENVV